MDKELALSIIRTLSAFQALSSQQSSSVIPDYLLEEISNQIDNLTKIVLED